MNRTEKILRENYRTAAVLRDGESHKILRLRNIKTGKDIIKITFTGSDEIYKKLLSVKNGNLPSILDVYEEDGVCTVLEEFIDGITVSDVLEKGLYTESGAVAVCLGICNALYALHKEGIIHRDIKPENVMITNSGRVVLIDFNAARFYKDFRSEDTRLIGTAGYAAPEQFGISQSDERSDIFAIGILMNVMLTGTHPVKKAAKGKIGKIIEKCTRLDPRKRYESVTELKKRLINL